MRITEFTIRNDASPDIRTVISEDRRIHIIHSKENSTGKTTLLRAILYALGFDIPNIDNIKFEKYEFCMKVVTASNIDANGERKHEISRKGKSVAIDGVNFVLPDDVYVVRELLFGTSNRDLADNMLGAIYFDQENGWTHFNRGVVVGGNSFDIDKYILGLNSQYDESTARINAELTNIDAKIKQFTQIVSVAKYQETLSKDVDATSDPGSEYDRLENDLLECRFRLSAARRELKEVNGVIESSRGFIDYIRSKKIYIKLDENLDELIDDDAEEPTADTSKGIVRVTEENLFYYDKQILVDEARKSVLTAEINELLQDIAKIEARLAELLTADDSLVVDRQVQRIFNQIPVSLDEAQKTLNNLKAEKKKLKDTLSAEIEQNSDWLDQIKKWYDIYCEKLEIPKESELDITTRRTSGRSGANFYKLVVAAKLACVKVLSEKLGYPVPIFCDSPSGREITHDKVKTVLALLNTDFPEHQIFIATIGEYKELFADANEILVDKDQFNM